MNRENRFLCQKSMSILIAVGLIIAIVTMFPITVKANSAVWNGTIDTSWIGSGTLADPYQITSAEELAGFASKVNGGEAYVNGYFKLTANIVLNNTAAWTS